MARILTVTPEKANRFQRLLLTMVKRQSGGFIPGMSQILLVDLRIARPTLKLYNYLAMRQSSPLSRLQREMIAVVVNGIIGGAP
jgi:hypothetical protein